MTIKSYFTRVDSSIMNDFENYLVSNDIEYEMLGPNMTNSEVSILYSVKADDSAVIAIRLKFPVRMIAQ